MSSFWQIPLLTLAQHPALFRIHPRNPTRTIHFPTRLLQQALFWAFIAFDSSRREP
ncbi:MAG: hypothetical protein JJT96_20180 [Opitutales bacterium]|nr:hypothetical protein [Opitutales bacterium]